MRTLVLALVLLVGTACGDRVSSDRSASERIVRAADTMEHLKGMRFSLEATSVATGSGSLGGDLVLRYRATGKLAPPARLRMAVTDPAAATLEIDGPRVLLNGQPAPASALRTLAGPIAVLEQLREAGTVRFAGLGFSRGNVTARYTIDRGDRGVVEVEVGLLDDLVRRQTFSIVQNATGHGSGLASVRTSYAIEYWDHGVEQEFGPIRSGEPNGP